MTKTVALKKSNHQTSINLTKGPLKTFLIAVALAALALTQPTNLFVEPARAQFASPSVNGAIGTNEYGIHTDGQNSQSTGTAQTWYMTWDGPDCH